MHGVISETLIEGFESHKKTRWELEQHSLKSDQPIERVVMVDQSPIGRNSRSTPASYLGIWTEVRKLFAQTIEAKAQGYTPGFFSHNSGKGRCPDCKGQGMSRLEMSFLAEASVVCETCAGSRYGYEAQCIHFQGRSIADVLALTFEEARVIFANHRKIHQVLAQACDLGLGYLTLGQASNTLSGGECQRIKLVAELSGTRRGHTLYLLDEPTTGLHRADVARLIKVLYGLVAQGHSVFVIEHDQDVLTCAQHVVELGPGPGDEGGRVVYQGSPTEWHKAKTPWARLLRETPSRAAANAY